MEKFKVDTLVIGAGVVGLAVARALALTGREVWLLEKESLYGSKTSSRNSEVIHAGIYYPADSLKAELCVKGTHMLYRYCETKRVPFKRCGKLIVAASAEQSERLQGIRKQAEANGVDDLQMLDSKALAALEPELSCQEALLSPSTGIIDSHAFMTELFHDFERAGGHYVCLSEVRFEKVASGRHQLAIPSQEALVEAKVVVNAAGLDAIALMRDAPGFDPAYVPGACFAKGSYFSCASRLPFSHLVYPVPEDGGLGVHLTLDMNGMARFGPDVEWLQPGAALDYQVDPSRQGRFVEAIASYWPGIRHYELVPDYAGIRPKISGPGEPAADFMVQGPEVHGLAGLVNLFGIESPGLTASLALADLVVARLEL